MWLYRVSNVVTSCVIVFFFNDTATTEIYTLSLHDALPISWRAGKKKICLPAAASTTSRTLRITSVRRARQPRYTVSRCANCARSEEHTSELQSRQYLVCRLLLEKKKTDSQSFADIILLLV